MRIKHFLAITAISLSSVGYTYASCDASALYGHMDNLSTELKALSFDVRSNNTADALVRIDKIDALLALAREETPYILTQKGVVGEELATRQKDFQNGIDRVRSTFVEIKAALAAEDMSTVKSLMTEVGESRKRGHRAFKSSDC